MAEKNEIDKLVEEMLDYKCRNIGTGELQKCYGIYAIGARLKKAWEIEKRKAVSCCECGDTFSIAELNEDGLCKSCAANEEEENG